MRRAPRKLTVLASLDVAGYSRLVESDERGTLVDLARIRRNILRPSVVRHSGDLFKTMGDGALIEFPSVEDAVEWAIEFQARMAKFNATRSGDPIRGRLGIALADVFVQGEDRFGAAVGFVVRLQEVAPPGGIAITHSVRWQLGRELAAQFNQNQWVELKGKTDEHFEIWTWTGVSPDGEAEPLRFGYGYRRLSDEEAVPAVVEAPPPEPVPPSSEQPSIVVLPFDNMTGDPGADPMIDGVIEEITASLSRVRDFTVIARNSAYAYKNRRTDVREVSSQLGVRYLVEGSLRKSGNRVRVTSQLIDAATGTHLWADSFDGVVEDIFDFEDEIATKVTGALRPSIWDAEIALARRKRAGDTVAYDLVLRSLPHLWAHRRDDNAEAIRLLDEAMRVDPDYARAKAIAAWARAQHVVYNWSDDLDRIREEGDRLISEAAPVVGDDPTALTALATATMLLFGDVDRARVFTDHALALDPNNAWAYTRRGFVEAYSGDPEVAQACFDKAIALSPLDPFSFNGYIGIGFARFAAGDSAGAVEWARRALGAKVGSTWAYRDLAAFLAISGDIDAARASLDRFVESRPDITVSQIADAMQFVQPAVLSRYLEGLRLAGLPED